MLIIKETEFVWRLNALWFGNVDDLSYLLEFSLILIPSELVKIIFYCFNKSNLDYYTVNNKIECIGEQNICFFRNEGCVVSFYFQEVSLNFVIDNHFNNL